MYLSPSRITFKTFADQGAWLLCVDQFSRLLLEGFVHLLRVVARRFLKDNSHIVHGILLLYVVISAEAPANHDNAHVGRHGHVQRQLDTTCEHEGGQAGRETAVDAGQHAVLETGNLPDVTSEQHHRLGPIVLVRIFDIHRVFSFRYVQNNINAFT